MTPLALLLVSAGALFLLVLARYQPPPPRPATAPANEFSAVRAATVLRTILGSDKPHPVGSAADARVRTAVLAELTRLGYSPHVEKGFACSYDAVCAEVQNVLARLEGRQRGEAVLLAAHYDSVPAGPGASDDGAGVASILEIARALKAGPPPLHPVIFLIDEGEEAGLLGAVEFMEQSPWAHEVGGAVNLEARGTSGPSLMFETGGHSRWLMPLFARSVPRPITNSLYYAMYRRMPNDTDFTVFSHHGIDGFNFAFLGSVAHYHTPLDNLANLDLASLQSQGEHGLGAVRALASAPGLGAQRGGDAAFFDLAAWRLVWWPLDWTPWLAALAVLLLLVCLALLIGRGRAGVGAVGRGIAAWPVAIAATLLVATGLLWLLRVSGAVPSGWVAHPLALVAALWLVGLAAAFAAAGWLGRKAGFWGLWIGAWLWWGIVSLIVSLVLPEGSFLWLAPTLAAGICGILALLFGRPSSPLALATPAGRVGVVSAIVAGVVPTTLAALLTFEVALLLYPAMGVPALPIVAILLASLVVTAGPMLAVAPSRVRRGIAWGPSVAWVLLTLVAAFLPAYSARSPQRMNYLYVVDAGKKEARTYLSSESGNLPAALVSEAGWSAKPEAIFPWSRGRLLPGPKAKELDSGPLLTYQPTLAIESIERRADGALEVKARLAAGGLPITGIAFPPAVKVESFTMGGETVPALSPRMLTAFRGWHRYLCVTTPAEGVEVSFTIAGSKSPEVALLGEAGWARVFGKAAGLESPIPRLRSATATASQSGDVFIIYKRTTLELTASTTAANALL